jgi:predicted RNase H-like HicB family nuclease
LDGTFDWMGGDGNYNVTMTHKFVYEKIAGGDFLVYADDFPFVSAVGKTKTEAKRKLLADIKEIHKFPSKK